MILVGFTLGMFILLCVIGVVLEHNGINKPDSDTITEQHKVGDE